MSPTGPVHACCRVRSSWLGPTTLRAAACVSVSLVSKGWCPPAPGPLPTPRSSCLLWAGGGRGSGLSAQGCCQAQLGNKQSNTPRADDAHLEPAIPEAVTAAVSWGQLPGEVAQAGGCHSRLLGPPHCAQDWGPFKQGRMGRW